MTNFNFGENLRNIRQQKGFSQEVMATSLNMSQPKYSRIERQSKIPDYQLNCSIAEILNIPLTELVPLSYQEHLVLLAAIHKPKLEIKVKAWLNTFAGKIITIAACGFIVDIVHMATKSICEVGFEASYPTIMATAWTVSLTLIAYMYYLFRKISK